MKLISSTNTLKEISAGNQSVDRFAQLSFMGIVLGFAFAEGQFNKQNAGFGVLVGYLAMNSIRSISFCLDLGSKNEVQLA